MKVPSFKKFLEEEDSKAIVQTGLNSKSIDNSVTKEIINSRLANATSNPFLTPYIALGSIARILAYVNIIVPQYTFLDRDEGEVVFDATQVGQIAGVNLDGSPAKTEADHFIYFSYSMNDEGYYDCFAALVDSDELEDIMDMGGDDDVDQFDVDQKVNEAAGSTPRTPRERTLAAMAFPKNKITHKDVLVGRGVVAKEEAELVDEGKDKQINKQKKNQAVANIIKKKIHPSLLPSLEYGRRELKKEKVEQIDEPKSSTLAAQAAQELKDRIAAHKASKSQPVRKPAAAPAPKSEPSVSDAAQKVKAAPQNPAAQELKARIAAHKAGKKVDEESINERKSSDPKGLAYKVTAASHAANPQWGPADHTQDPKTHFGTAATRSSTLAAVRSIRAQRSQGGFDANNPKHVDAAAKAVHGSPQDYEGKPRGWSQTAMTHSGQSPEQKERRAKLTGPYNSLSEPEQEKDKEIVRTVAANIRSN